MHADTPTLREFRLSQRFSGVGLLVGTLLVDDRKVHRADILRRVGRGALEPHAAESQIDAMRWLGDLGHSLYRLANHLSGERGQQLPPGSG